MTSGTTPASTATTWGQRNWVELLSNIEQKSVIPVIGPELVLVEWEGRKMTLEQYVALELAWRLELPAEAVGVAPSVYQVMCLYYQLSPEASKRYPSTVQTLSDSLAVSEQQSFIVPNRFNALLLSDHRREAIEFSTGHATQMVEDPPMQFPCSVVRDIRELRWRGVASSEQVQFVERLAAPYLAKCRLPTLPGS